MPIAEYFKRGADSIRDLFGDFVGEMYSTSLTAARGRHYGCRCRVSDIMDSEPKRR